MVRVSVCNVWERETWLDEAQQYWSCDNVINIYKGMIAFLEEESDCVTGSYSYNRIQTIHWIHSQMKPQFESALHSQLIIFYSRETLHF